MHEITNIKKNSFYYLISSSSRLIANSLIFIIVARFYGVENFGSFSTAHLISTMFLLLADFGFDLLIITEIARNRNSTISVINKYLPIKLVFSGIALLILWGISVFFEILPVLKILLFIFSLNMLFTTLLNAIYATFKGIEQFQHEAKISFSLNFFLLIVVILLSYLKVELYVIALAMVITRFVAFLSGIFIFKKLFGQISLKINFSDLLTDSKLVLIFGFHLILGTLFFQADTVLLYLLKGEAEAGLYQAVFKLLIIFLMLPDILVGTLLPTITRYFALNNDDWMKVSKLLFKILFILALPISLFFYRYADSILSTIYNRQEYLQSIDILKLAGFVIVIRFLSEPFAMLLTVKNKQNIRTWIVAFAAIFNISLNIYLIPIYGMHGSIIISLITNLIAGILYFIFSISKYPSWMFDLKLVFPLILILTLFLLTEYFQFITLWTAIAIIVLTYFIPVIIFNFSSEERKALFLLNKDLWKI